MNDLLTIYGEKALNAGRKSQGKGLGGKIRREICIICWVFSGFSATARTMTQCVSINQLAVIQPGKERNERRREVEVEREKKNCVMVVRAKTIAKNSSKISDAIFGYTKSAR